MLVILERKEIVILEPLIFFNKHCSYSGPSNATLTHKKCLHRESLPL